MGLAVFWGGAAVILGSDPESVEGDGYVISKPTNIKPWMAT